MYRYVTANDWTRLIRSHLSFQAFKILVNAELALKLIRDRCYGFLNIFAEKFCKKMAFLTQNKAKLCKILTITLVFEKNAIFFAENWGNR
jgi:hypothetical protein